MIHPSELVSGSPNKWWSLLSFDVCRFIKQQPGNTMVIRVPFAPAYEYKAW